MEQNRERGKREKGPEKAWERNVPLRKSWREGREEGCLLGPRWSRLELLCYGCWPWGRHVFFTSLSFPLCKYGKLHVRPRCKIFWFYDIGLRLNWLVSGSRGWWLRFLEPECFCSNPAHSLLPVWPWASHWTLLVRDTSTLRTLTGGEHVSVRLSYYYTPGHVLADYARLLELSKYFVFFVTVKKQTGLGTGKKKACPFCAPPDWIGRERTHGRR